MALSEQRLNQLNARAADIEERLRGKETELAQTRTQFQQLTADFRYNLKLLEDRDAELERLDGAVVTHRATPLLAHSRSVLWGPDALHIVPFDASVSNKLVPPRAGSPNPRP